MTIRLFEVGGSIRDELMGIDNPPDRDFCAESPDGWEALLAWCHDNMKRVFLVTPEFFTVRGMMPSGTSIDVVMCRKDGPSSDGRHPDHVEPGSLLDDLARRDFTVNAMAREVDPKSLEPIGDIIDPFRGREDLVAHSLRCVGDTKARLEEDGLRVLRAARFCVTKRLGLSHSLAEELRNPNTWRFMKETVSVERIREELHKMLKADTVSSLRFLTTNCCAMSTIDILFGHDSTIWLKPTLEKR